jgi:hypothetical protein
MGISVQMTIPVRADHVSFLDGIHRPIRAKRGHLGHRREQFACFLALRCAAKIATQGCRQTLEHFGDVPPDHAF